MPVSDGELHMPRRVAAKRGMLGPQARGFTIQLIPVFKESYADSTTADERWVYERFKAPSSYVP
jgi:hypothetical protein